MERLVITYTVSDGCTYDYQVVVPVVYESPEAFIVGFEKACKDARAEYRSLSEKYDRIGDKFRRTSEKDRAALVEERRQISLRLTELVEEFTFANQKWNWGVFFEDGTYYGPTIQTVDEWFVGA